MRFLYYIDRGVRPVNAPWTYPHTRHRKSLHTHTCPHLYPTTYAPTHTLTDTRQLTHPHMPSPVPDNLHTHTCPHLYPTTYTRTHYPLPRHVIITVGHVSTWSWIQDFVMLTPISSRISSMMPPPPTREAISHRTISGSPFLNLGWSAAYHTST